MTRQGYVEVDLGLDSPEYAPQAVEFVNLFGPMLEQTVKQEMEKLLHYAEIDSKKNIKRLDIMQTKQLANSLKWRAFCNAGGDTAIFEVELEWYAKFVELALGKGSPLTYIEPVTKKNWGPLYRRDNGRRMARPFYMIEMMKQVRRFQYWMQQRYAIKGHMIIASAFTDALKK